MHFFRRISAGDLATANFDKIQKMSEQLAECITRNEVEVQYQNLYEIRTTNMKIQKDLDTTIKVTDQLARAHAKLSSSVVAVEAVLPNKLDRSEVNYIESLADRVELYDAFRTDSTAQLQALQEFKQSALSRLSVHDSHLGSVDRFCGQVTVDLALLASKDELRIVANEVKGQGAQIKLLASKTSVVEVSMSHD